MEFGKWGISFKLVFLMQSFSILIIGYGNNLRSDDGVGRYLAEIIDQQQLPLVKTLSVHQLTPELVLEIAESQAVIFIDAITQCRDAIAFPPFEISLQSLEPSQDKTRLGHTSNPEQLLSLCKNLYHQCPSAWLLTIPTHNFEFGETFSALTQNAIAPALIILTQLIKILSLKFYAPVEN
jgi:hydrogenase maturation protease